MKRALSLLWGLCLACASPPAPKHPDAVDLPAGWVAGGQQGQVEQTWWSPLGGAPLEALVAEALEHNRDLQAAAARLDMARAQARMAGAALQPQAQIAASAARARRNFLGFPLPGQPGQEVLSTTSDNFGVHLNLSWEIDLWGRLRAGAGAALADAQAARAEWRGARLSLTAQTARAYFAAIEATRQVELARATAESYALSLEQIDDRYRRGLRPSLDLRLGRSNLAAARAQLQQRLQVRDRALRQLEVLLGRYPAAALRLEEDLPALPGPPPAGLPAELVSRRPDLVAAERRLAASEGRLAEARAALYPRISLTASGGRSSEEVGDLLNGDFSVWNLVANLGQPLFQGGRLRAGVDLAAAGREQSLALYARSVLQALSEVESALAAEAFLAAQEEALHTAATEAVEARQLADERYGRGLVDLITLLEAQRRAFDAESRLLAVRRQRLDARLDLHLALGGGFAETPPSSERAEN